MSWVRLSLIVTAGLFMFDQVFDLGPVPTLALFVCALLNVVFRNRRENGSGTALVALLVLAVVAALALLDAGVSPVLRIS